MPLTVWLPTFVSIAKAVFQLDRRHINTQTKLKTQLIIIIIIIINIFNSAYHKTYRNSSAAGNKHKYW